MTGSIKEPPKKCNILKENIKEILKIVKSNKEENLLKELKIKDNCDSYKKKQMYKLYKKGIPAFLILEIYNKNKEHLKYFCSDIIGSLSVDDIILLNDRFVNNKEIIPYLEELLAFYKVDVLLSKIKNDIKIGEVKEIIFKNYINKI